MAHVDDGQLNALLDGELSADETRVVEAHVAGCAECAARLEEARAFLSEAGELLSVLTPPARPAETVKADAVPPRIAKTSKEIAVSLDGRTEMTPAIRPVFKHEVPATPRRGWKLPDLEKMAWAASLVLCLGVGYLANEVYHLKSDGQTGRRADGQTGSRLRQVRPSHRLRSSGVPRNRTVTRHRARLPVRPSARRPVSLPSGPRILARRAPSRRSPSRRRHSPGVSLSSSPRTSRRRQQRQLRRRRPRRAAAHSATWPAGHRARRRRPRPLRREQEQA